VKTIWLEFQHENGAVAANGTDVTYYIDGRWSFTTTTENIYQRVAELRESHPSRDRFRKQLFLGYTESGTAYQLKKMADQNPPEWVTKQKED